MNFKKYLPTLVCGFGAAVLSTVPGIKNFSCCLIVPAAATISILLDKKINYTNEKVLLGKTLGFGFLTGLFATIFITTFEMIVTYFSKSNDFIQSLPESTIIMRQLDVGPFFGPMVDESLKLSKSVAKEIQKNGFSFFYLLMIFTSNFIINSIFGIIGGALGMSLVNRKVREEDSEL